MFQVVLSNKDHMEYGVVTVPFPIPEDQYDDITRMLEVLHIGSELSPDCMVESVESDWPVLRLLTGQEINLDELDYLAKRLDGISPYEKTQFQAAAERYGLSQVTDLINLTFCCDQATVIVDFSDLEQVGRIHYLMESAKAYFADGIRQNYQEFLFTHQEKVLEEDVPDIAEEWDESDPFYFSEGPKL